jgi:CP family cyanate transporter-like MFS transporter
LAALCVLLVGLNLRPAITAVALVLPDIRADYRLDAAAAGLLTTLPLLMFVGLSALMPLVAGRFGAPRVILAALVVLMAGFALRLVPGAPWMFAGMAVVGAAIAAGNVLLPAFVKGVYPQAAGPLTGLYTVSLYAGPALAAAATVPIARAAGSWQIGITVWAALAVLALPLWLTQTRPPSARVPGREKAARSAHTGSPGAWRAKCEGTAPQECGAPARSLQTRPPGTRAEQRENTAGPERAAPAWPAPTRSPGASVMRCESAAPPELAAGARSAQMRLPAARVLRRGKAARREPTGSVWRDPTAWAVTGYFAVLSALFYTVSAWLPTMLADRGLTPEAAALALTWVNAAAIPCALAVSVAVHRSRRQVWATTSGSCLIAAGLTGLMGAPAGAAAFWAVVFGLGHGVATGIAYSLPLLRAKDAAHTAALGGMSQTAGYALSAAGPVGVGAVYQATGSWTPVLVILLVGIGLQCLAGLKAGRPVPSLATRLQCAPPAREG